jgi:hypothetical protein
LHHIRGLGFIGLIVSGSHHQPHHLAMAKGEWDPERPLKSPSICPRVGQLFGVSL